MVALLVGSSAPWWWNKVFAPETSRPDVTTTDDGSGSSGGGDSGGSSSDLSGGTSDGDVTRPDQRDTDEAEQGGGDGATTGVCEIAITNPLVTLYEGPDTFGLEVGGIEPGSYVVEDVTTVSFAGSPQRWFLISADGRSGWLQDSTILIDSKSSSCP